MDAGYGYDVVAYDDMDATLTRRMELDELRRLVRALLCCLDGCSGPDDLGDGGCRRSAEATTLTSGEPTEGVLSALHMGV